MNNTITKLSLLSRLLRWADGPTTELPAHLRPVHRFVRLFCIVSKEYLNNDLSLRSAALTYTILLSLVPLLAFSTAAVKGLAGGDHIRDAAYSYIAAFEPSPNDARTTPAMKNRSGTEENEAGQKEEPESLTGHLRTAVDKLFAYVERTDFATLGTIGIIGIFISVILVLSHIETAMNTIWNVESGRSIGRKIADYLTLLILMPISINVAFAATAFIKNPDLAAKLNYLIPFPFVQALLLKALPVLFITATFHIMYLFFPNTKVKTIPSLLGALLAANLWFMVQNLYITLQVGVSRYNAIYGSFATLPLFLIWMYLGWLFILIGAQVSFALQNFRNYHLNRLQTTPALQLSTAIDIMAILYQNFQSQNTLTENDLKDHLPQYPGDLVDNVLDCLLQHNLIHLSSRDDRLLPAVPKEKFSKTTLITAVMGEPTVAGPGGYLTRKALDSAKATL